MPAGRRPAVVVLTGDALSLRSEAALLDPAPAIVEKPFDPVQLAALVRRLGAARRDGRQAVAAGLEQRPT
jgi:CheY-like chemotaxis protein